MNQRIKRDVEEIGNKCDTKIYNEWAERFIEHHQQLIFVARQKMNPLLMRRISAEDIVQDTLAEACHKIYFFENNPDIPIYLKLKMLLLQNISVAERKHLQSSKRDAYKEVDLKGYQSEFFHECQEFQYVDTKIGPHTQACQKDRYFLLQKAIESLAENDRQILELRHFEDMSNNECARMLKIDAKAASIRYVRALQRLQKQLIELTEFRP